MTRTVRDGHAETWWAADAVLGWWGPDGARRLVVATADPRTLPEKATWYLVTNLPRPGGPREAGSPHLAAPPFPRQRRRGRGAVRAIRARLSPGSRCSSGGRHGPRRPRSPSFRP